MKKNVLIIITLIIGLQAYAQIDLKNINHVPMYNPTVVIDISTPSAMGGDDVLWSEDFADSTMTNIITEDIGGYGDWHWDLDSPAGMWSENAGIIQSETPENGFMLMEADFYNTSPQNNVANGEVGENQLNAEFTIGPIDLSMSETRLQATQLVLAQM